MDEPYQFHRFKEPTEVVDYGIRWTNELTSDETIDESEWDATGVTVDDPAGDIDGAVTSVILSGGESDTLATVTNTIVTSAVPPRTLSRTIRLRIL